MNKTKQTLALLTAAMVSSTALVPVFAQDTRHPVRSDVKQAMHNPVVKQAAIGGALGAAAGLFSRESSIWRGLGIGALTGAGTGLVSDSKTMNRHPLVKSTAQGAIVGTGTSAVFRRSKGKGALVGAGAGAGWHFLKDYFDKK